MAGITGISGELGVDYMAGRIWGSRAEVVLPSFRITSRSFPLHSTGRFHFDIDDPSLNGEGYDDVERFCAENQYLFSKSPKQDNGNWLCQPFRKPQQYYSKVKESAVI
jgi:hypothetical protein